MEIQVEYKGLLTNWYNNALVMSYDDDKDMVSDQDGISLHVYLNRLAAEGWWVANLGRSESGHTIILVRVSQ